jgi:DNA-binding CsgD family transcriptional regulator
MKTLPFAKVRGVLRLMGEAHELADSAAVERHLLSGMLAMVGGVGALRILLTDYRPGSGKQVGSGTSIGFDVTLEQRVVQQYYDNTRVDPAVASLADRIGKHEGDTVCCRRADLLDDASWYRSPYVAELRRPARVDDSIYAGRWHADQSCEGLGIYRAWTDPPFSEDDRELVHFFQRDVFPQFVLPQKTTVQLSRREQETFDWLLRGKRRKEIAAAMGISAHTVDQYIKSLYRRLGVSAYPELVARYRGP